MGKPIVMGRKTFDSIGRPLPGRKNIVISRNQQLSLDGCITVQSVAQAMQAAGAADEVMIMGGASFYQLLLPYVHRLYLTHVEHCFSGDAWFPVVDYTAWEIAHEERHEPDAKNDYAYRFVDYIRKDQPPVWVD